MAADGSVAPYQSAFSGTNITDLLKLILGTTVNTSGSKSGTESTTGTDVTKGTQTGTTTQAGSQVASGNTVSAGTTTSGIPTGVSANMDAVINSLLPQVQGTSQADNVVQGILQKAIQAFAPTGAQQNAAGVNNSSTDALLRGQAAANATGTAASAVLQSQQQAASTIANLLTNQGNLTKTTGTTQAGTTGQKADTTQAGTTAQTTDTTKTSTGTKATSETANQSVQTAPGAKGGLLGANPLESILAASLVAYGGKKVKDFLTPYMDSATSSIANALGIGEGGAQSMYDTLAAQDASQGASMTALADATAGSTPGAAALTAGADFAPLGSSAVSGVAGTSTTDLAATLAGQDASQGAAMSALTDATIPAEAPAAADAAVTGPTSMLAPDMGANTGIQLAAADTGTMTDVPIGSGDAAAIAGDTAASNVVGANTAQLSDTLAAQDANQGAAMQSLAAAAPTAESAVVGTSTPDLYATLAGQDASQGAAMTSLATDVAGSGAVSAVAGTSTADLAATLAGEDAATGAGMSSLAASGTDAAAAGGMGSIASVAGPIAALYALGPSIADLVLGKSDNTSSIGPGTANPVGSPGYNSLVDSMWQQYDINNAMGLNTPAPVYDRVTPAAPAASSTTDEQNPASYGGYFGGNG